MIAHIIIHDTFLTNIIEAYRGMEKKRAAKHKHGPEQETHARTYTKVKEQALNRKKCKLLHPQVLGT